MGLFDEGVDRGDRLTNGKPSVLQRGREREQEFSQSGPLAGGGAEEIGFERIQSLDSTHKEETQHLPRCIDSLLPCLLLLC